MHTVVLPRLGTDVAWRDAARRLLAAEVPPEDVLWQHGQASPSLFAETPVPASGQPLTVPKSFVDLAAEVVWHSDPERFARLYALLWRLRSARGLMTDRGDPAVATLRAMEKGVLRCRHKMTAFVRFREIDVPGGTRRRFAAWFEPTHHTMELTAPFFARRFGDMDWLIATPDISARAENGTVTLHEDLPRPDLPQDAHEELWRTYFCNIFNPARVKIRAMTSEMPKKYWKNLPEAQAIPALLASAEARVRAMAEAAPTLPPAFAERLAERRAAAGVAAVMTRPVTFDDLRRRASEESRDPPPGYGRIVMGEGPEDAALMIVGEQPGDVEDRDGRPFVGPAGQVFDRIAGAAGLDRSAAYVTNAVKRFKFEMRGKRRLHQSPNGQDIEHARWWLAHEIALVRPRLILALGGTAAETLTGTRKDLLKRRGRIEQTDHGPVFLTVHPSYLLRLPTDALRTAEQDRFRADLAAARAQLDALAA